MENNDAQAPGRPVCRVIGFDGGLTVIIPPAITWERNPWGVTLLDPYGRAVACLAVTDLDESGNPLPQWKFNSGLDCLQYLLAEHVQGMQFKCEVNRHGFSRHP